MDQLSLGVMCRSAKENEHRRPIHPLHFDRIDPDLRSRIFLEHGYGERFGVSDEQTFPHLLELRNDGIEAANLALEGYGLKIVETRPVTADAK